LRSILIEKYINPSETVCSIGHLADFAIDKEEFWLNKDGVLHSILGQPSEIYYLNGKVVKKEWHKKGRIHKDKNIPAVYFYNNNEEIIETQYWRDGKYIK
jgi:hypothetical protein